MRSDVITRLLLELVDRHGEGDVSVTKCPESLLPKLDALEVSRDLKRLFRFDWLDKCLWLEMGVSIDGLSAILASKDLPPLLKHGIVPIGNAANGDLLVLRVVPPDLCEVGFVAHEELRGSEDSFEPAKGYARATKSLDAFLFRHVDRLYLPSDFYECEQWVELQREMGTDI